MQEKGLCDIKKIRSDYIRKFILGFLSHKNRLDIVRYNNVLKKQIGVNLEYYKYYNSIEIEITTVINNFEDIINLKHCQISDIRFIHFYKNFNDENETIFCGTKEKIENKITILIENGFSDLKKLFKGCDNLKKIKFKRFKLDYFEDMSFMFYNCINLESINFIEFNTSKVKSFKGMFGLCDKLKVLDLSKFDTNNVIDMSCMFYCCCHLISVNLRSFNTENVLSMKCMFSGCFRLTTLDLMNFNTLNVDDMEGMFAFDCCLEEVKFSSLFKIKINTNINDFFNGCFYLKRTNLTNFNNNNPVNRGVFVYGSNLLPSVDRKFLFQKINSQ